MPYGYNEPGPEYGPVFGKFPVSTYESPNTNNNFCRSECAQAAINHKFSSTHDASNRKTAMKTLNFLK
jgi:hypothetical protein